MNALLVDDELLALRELQNAVTEAIPSAAQAAFHRAKDAMEYIKNNSIDLAFLDINMRFVDGLSMASQIRELYPKANIIFCTGYGEYTSDAFKLHASGYITKPVTAEKIKEEFENLRYQIPDRSFLVTVKYYEGGNGIDVFDRNGSPLKFKRSRSKAVFRILVDSKGKPMSSSSISALLWGDNLTKHVWDERNRNYLFQLITDIKKTLKDAGLYQIFKHDYTGYYLDMSQIKVEENS